MLIKTVRQLLNLQANLLTYAAIGSTTAVLGLSMIYAFATSRPPARVPSDAQKYDRKTQTYSG